MAKPGVNSLEFSRTLTVSLGLQFPVEVPELGVKVSAVRGRGSNVGPADARGTSGGRLRRRTRRSRAGRARWDVAHDLVFKQAVKMHKIIAHLSFILDM